MTAIFSGRTIMARLSSLINGKSSATTTTLLHKEKPLSAFSVSLPGDDAL